MINEEQARRINSLDNILIRHSQIDRAIKAIERCKVLSKGAAEPINLLLTGDGGVGKTTACRYIEKTSKQMTEIDGNFEITRIPSFYTSVPERATPKKMAGRMLSALNQPNPSKGVSENLTERLLNALSRSKTEIIMLDELHHLLDITGNRKDVNQWLKHLINTAKIPVVIAGTPDCESIIDDKDDRNQLARRFTTRIHLKNLDFGSSKKGDFRVFAENLSKIIQKKLDLSVEVDFKSSSNSFQLYIASKGNPGILTTLIKEACTICVEENKSEVTRDHLIYAYECLTLPIKSTLRGNPFEMQKNQLNNAIRQLK